MRLLLLLLLLVCFGVKAQDKVMIYHKASNTSDTFYVDKYWKLNTPGEELRLASKEYYKGLSLNVIGSGIICMTVVLDPLSYASIRDYKTDRATLGVMGGSLLLLGIYYSIHSNIHLKRAGIIMDERGVGLTIPIKYNKR